VKEEALVSVLCVLLSTNILGAADAGNVERLLGGCAGQKESKLAAAVGKLTDQVSLAKVAVDARCWWARVAAVGKLTDQALLAKLAIQDDARDVRLAAVEKLTDQAALAKAAIQDHWATVRRAAVEKLTDQTALAKVATEDADGGVRLAAVGKLTDQPLLAKAAIQDPAMVYSGDPMGARVSAGEGLAAVDKLTDQALLADVAIQGKGATVRRAAVQKLTDQAALAKVATAEVGDRVDPASGGYAAIEKLTDQTLLAKVAGEGKDRHIRVKAVAAMDGSNPALKGLAGDFRYKTGDLVESAARINLAIQEPRIRDRFPRIVLVARASKEVQGYRQAQSLHNNEYGLAMNGESVSFVLSQGRETLAKREWISRFPQTTSDLGYVAANVDGAVLLKELLHNPVFTQDDLARLSSSQIPEVRVAVVLNLTDQALLARIASEDASGDVRLIARLSLDQIRRNAK
jgi:hypothetical protein